MIKTFKMNNLKINNLNKWIHNKIWDKMNQMFTKVKNNLKMYLVILEMNLNIQRKRNQLINLTSKVNINLNQI
jgi:hypothetical protein